MINRQSLGRPTLPRQPPLPLTLRLHTLPNLARKRRKPKGAEFEHAALQQLCSLGGKSDLGAVLVVRGPFADVGEEGPDLGCGDVLGDCFVGDEVVGCAGGVGRREDDGGLGGHAGREGGGDVGRC